MPIVILGGQRFAKDHEMRGMMFGRPSALTQVTITGMVGTNPNRSSLTPISFGAFASTRIAIFPI